MPPQLPRNSLSSVVRCSASSFPLRAFSVTARRPFIGPENPKFIDIPMPPQRHAKRKPVIRGVLPPPRNIFHRRGPNRIDPEYIKATIPEAKARAEPTDERTAWRRRLAATRRANFQEAIHDLHARKVRQDNLRTKQTRTKQRDRHRRLNAPEREDERLTNPTVTNLLNNLHIGLPDPDREARVAAKAERFRAKEEQKKEERRNALHTLYMHAREFITTEKELNAEIDRIFVPSPFGKDNEGKDNIWDALGAPPTVQDMLDAVNSTQKTAFDFHRGPSHVSSQRMKKIAEELTGGKMD